MPNFIYVNGNYFPKEEASISVNDRAYQFGDSVYEVVIYRKKIFFDYDLHIQRLRKSLKSLDINLKISDKSLFIIIKNLLKKNNINFGSIYIQVSRGISEREHSFYKMDIKPTLIIITKKFKNDFEKFIDGINVISVNDTRWQFPNIKTTQLLPNVLAKTEANKRNAYEAIFVDKEGFVTEGSSSNIWILNNENILLTRKLDGSILPGITRKTIFKCAKINQIIIKEQKFTLNDLLMSKEVFITSASSFVTPVVKLNDQCLGNGKIGKFTSKLRETYFEQFNF